MYIVKTVRQILFWFLLIPALYEYQVKFVKFLKNNSSRRNFVNFMQCVIYNLWFKYLSIWCILN